MADKTPAHRHIFSLYTASGLVSPTQDLCDQGIWPDAVLDHYPGSPIPFHHTETDLQKQNPDSELGTVFVFSFCKWFMG